MALLDLWFESGQDSLSVRHFSVNEALSRPFEVGVMAASRVDDIDFESIIGRKASFKIAASGVSAARTWQGICNHFEQVQSEPNGLSTYFLRIVPELWLLTQKQDYRVFQHLSIPDIAKKILEPWGIQPVVNVDATAHQPQEYRVQYGETDYAFLTRLLEDAGISFLLSQGDKGPRLTLTDKPQGAEARAGGAIPYADNPNPEGGKAFLTKVSVSREMKPGAFTIRDHDFRRRAGYALLGKAPEASGVEAKLEQYQYRPGSFIVDGQGGQEASASEKEGQALASRGLEAARANRESMSFETNLTDLAPGSVFSMSGHSRSSTSGSLLATELNLQGTPGQQWTITGKAAPTSAAHRPARATPRPKIAGVQSAVVVGPQGEEIHTDEHGRIKVQFHWDRQGQMDDKSSCWVRVSQGWAGGGFGMIALPRVGQEVTVGFFEGDPDQPVVIGRVFNTENRVPYKLPDNKTRTTWRSESTPSTGGSAC